MSNLYQINGKAMAFDEWTVEAMTQANAPTMPRGIERPASLASEFDTLLPVGPQPKQYRSPRFVPTWGGVATASFIGAAIGYAAGLVQGLLS